MIKGGIVEGDRVLESKLMSKRKMIFVYLSHHGHAAKFGREKISVARVTRSERNRDSMECGKRHGEATKDIASIFMHIMGTRSIQKYA